MRRDFRSLGEVGNYGSPQPTGMVVTRLDVILNVDGPPSMTQARLEP